MHGSGEFAHSLAEKGLIDEFEVYLNPLVWGLGNVHVLGDRGTVRMALRDVQRFESGVSASLMLEFVMPPEVRSSFKTPPESSVPDVCD